MVCKSKIGILYWITLIFASVITIALAILAIYLKPVWSSWLVALIAAGFAASTVFYLIPRLKDTVYEISEFDLLVKTGRNELRIPFNSIVEISLGVKSMHMQPALSFNRVEVKYKTLKGVTDIVHISPENESEFLGLLKSKV